MTSPLTAAMRSLKIVQFRAKISAMETGGGPA
jgi:hypothetical protein